MIDFKGKNSSAADRASGIDSVQFDFVEQDRDGFVVLCPKGGLCNATARYFKNRLYDLSCEEGCKIVMSLKDVDFIDSVGLGTMIAAHKNCDHYGGMIVYCSMNPMIFKNMQMLNMDKFLQIAPDIESAEKLLEW
ncbi:STAS domain-containing protein [Maridesulfovibrio sp. FT414]|uniref:STAS domain-containing protein n=1 Tax=Maridesulfovibrio sp. FT414 TaxID=2979469 RepID=UPI003D804830